MIRGALMKTAPVRVSQQTKMISHVIVAHVTSTKQPELEKYALRCKNIT
jgi:hypothetical protein